LAAFVGIQIRDSYYGIGLEPFQQEADDLIRLHHAYEVALGVDDSEGMQVVFVEDFGHGVLTHVPRAA